MIEKYETPEVEFVEMEEKDVISCSSDPCDEYEYGDVCGDLFG